MAKDTHVWVTTKTMDPNRSMPLAREYAEANPDLFEIDEKHAVRDERTGRLLDTVLHTEKGRPAAPPSGSARRASSTPKRIPTDKSARLASSTTSGGTSGTPGATTTTTGNTTGGTTTNA